MHVFFLNPPQSGLVSRDTPEQLIIALEPEAASIYCRKLRLHQMVDLATSNTQNGFNPNDNVGSGVSQGGSGQNLLHTCPGLKLHTDVSKGSQLFTHNF